MNPYNEGIDAEEEMAIGPEEEEEKEEDWY